MGRPLNKKYFANTNYQDFGTANVGGESVASVTAPAGTLADLVDGTYTIPAASIGAPDIAGGAKPVLSVTVTDVTTYTVTVVSAGSGYTSAPTITFDGSVAGGTGSATPVATLTATGTARQNGIAAYAMTVPAGNNLLGDIIKQVSGRRYKVRTSEGVAVCKLVTDGVANAVGEMTITATDANGNTYYVSKLTGRKAVLVRLTDDGSDGDWLFATGAIAKWSFAAAAGSVVQIANA